MYLLESFDNIYSFFLVLVTLLGIEILNLIFKQKKYKISVISVL